MQSILFVAMLAAGAAMTSPAGADVPQAPVPAQILSGKRVFIAYAGGELSLPLTSVFSGRPDRVYNQFYAAMKKWGRYELVGAPAEADLVFQIGLEFNDVSNDMGIKTPEIGRVRLDIRDPHSNVLLWSLREYVRAADLQGNRDKNLDRAMGVIVDGMKDLAGSRTP